MAESREDLYGRLARMSEQMAVTAERERQLEERVAERERKLEEKVNAIEAEIVSLRELAAKGRGGLLVLLAIGSIIGVFVGAWDKILRLFGGH